jgi:CRISPR-associated RAMP protein (TIGR02581 family)
MSEPTYSFAALQNRLTVRGTLVAETGLRIGAGRDTEVTGNDLPVLRDVLDRPFLPGASLKGVLRAQAEGLVRALDPQQALDLLEIEAWQREVIAKLKENVDDPEGDRALTTTIWSHSTMIDQTFGAPWLAGRLFVKDAHVVEDYWFGQYEVRNGVAINRDTETQQGGFLYDYEVVPAGSRFQFELVLENAEPWQLGMVWLLLKPWRRGDIQVGGFRTRGLGYVRLEGPEGNKEPSVTYNEISAKSADRVEAAINLLLNKGETITDDTKRVKDWAKDFRDELAKLVGATGAANV